MLEPVTRSPDFDDESKTENTRSAYPLHFIPNASPTGRAGQPKNIVMLTADAFGVMPPIAKLTPAQAMYHFLSGYTAKVAGTERGVTEPTPEFSACFGSPFLPRHPSEYGALLQAPDRRARCFLLAGQHRLDRRRLRHGQAHADQGDARAAFRRARRLARQRRHSAPTPGSALPCRWRCPGVDPAILDPRSTWADKAAYDRQAKKLVGMFIDNFAKFEDHVDARGAGCRPARAGSGGIGRL